MGCSACRATIHTSPLVSATRSFAVLSHPATKYRAFPAIDLPNRQWPSRTITQPPIWMSTDLRDGNQSLFEPMNAERKMRMFRTLLQIGFKEIEVGFPSASQTDFDFVRQLIEGGHVPDDVTIEVLTQSREHLIRRTIESLKGARRAIVHVYNATAPVFRDVVFGMSKPEVKALAVSSVRLIKEITATMPETEWVLQYSPEVFTSTELEFACEVDRESTRLNYTHSQTSNAVFFFNDTAPTEIYPLSLHDALPICHDAGNRVGAAVQSRGLHQHRIGVCLRGRSGEHTSELHSQSNLQCRLFF